MKNEIKQRRNFRKLTIWILASSPGYQAWTPETREDWHQSNKL